MPTEPPAPHDAAEYARRLHTVQEGLQADGLDAIVSGDAGDWLAPTGDARYLTGFTITNMQGAISGLAVVVPAEGAPVLVVPGGPQGCFADWARAMVPDGVEVAPAASLLPTVTASLISVTGQRTRIGVGQPFEGSDALADALAGRHVVAAADMSGTGRSALARARAVKSPLEIAWLARAQRAANDGMVAFIDAVTPGRRHVEAQSEAHARAVRAGADDALVIMNSGNEPWMWWHYQGGRRFPDQGIVTLEVNARVDGYCAQLARSGTVGPATPVQAALLDSGLDGIEAMVQELRPGATGHDLWVAGTTAMARGGFRPWGRLGHGMGLSMDEGVAVVEGDRTPLEAGMVIAVHACPWDPATRQSVIVGEQYVLDPDGARPLSTASPERSFHIAA